MSYGAAMFINAVIFNNLRVVAEGFASAEYNAEYLKFGIPAMIIELLVVVAFLVVKLRKGKVHTWAAVAERMPEKNTPMISFLTPLLPVVLILIGCPTIPAFLASMFYALLTTGKIKSYKGMCDVVQKSLHEGISDIGGVLGFLYTVVMFAPMAEMNAPIFQASWATSSSTTWLCWRWSSPSLRLWPFSAAPSSPGAQARPSLRSSPP